MANRLAGILGLIAFATCLIAGGFEADNSFGTTVWRAMQALVGTIVVAWVIGLMAEKMLAENAKTIESATIGEKVEKTSKDPAGVGR